MKLQRRIALASALLAIGLGAGHFVQNRTTKAQTLAALPEVTPSSVVPLAAGPEDVATPPSKPALPAAPALAPAAPAPIVSAEACPRQLDLMARDRAMIGLTLIAPCHPAERVVVKHGGMVVTAKTSSTGTLFLDLPGLKANAEVELAFADGTKTAAQIDLPEVAGVQRFAVQWLDQDAFQVHAFENGADYGQKGHVSAADPHRPAPGMASKGGYLTLLGDSTVDLPMLAEIYTYPMAGAAELVVEAAVTEATCGRELLGETLTSLGGAVEVAELTLAMPDCAAAGDILVLKNLVPEMTLAAK